MNSKLIWCILCSASSTATKSERAPVFLCPCNFAMNSPTSTPGRKRSKTRSNFFSDVERGRVQCLICTQVFSVNSIQMMKHIEAHFQQNDVPVDFQNKERDKPYVTGVS